MWRKSTALRSCLVNFTTKSSSRGPLFISKSPRVPWKTHFITLDNMFMSWKYQFMNRNDSHGDYLQSNPGQRPPDHNRYLSTNHRSLNCVPSAKLGNLRTTTKFTTTTSVDWEKTGTRTSVSAGKRKLKMQSIGRSTTTTLNVNKHVEVVQLWCSFATKFFRKGVF